MEKTTMMRWSKREVPRFLWIPISGIALIGLLLCFSPYRPGPRPDRAGWEHLSWRYVAGQNGAAIFSPHLKRRNVEVKLQLVAFAPKDFDFVVLDNGPSRGSPRFGDLRGALRNRGCVAGVNGGFFDPASFRPTGLMISEGMATGEFDPHHWGAAVVSVKDGQLAVEDNATFRPSEAVTDLLQTGPWLVRDGSRTGKFENDYPARRTFLAEGDSGIWVLGNTSEITLQDLSEMLAGGTFGRALTGKTKNSVNLDGGPSSGIWAQAAIGEAIHVREQTIVRNFIGLRPRAGTPQSK